MSLPDAVGNKAGAVGKRAPVNALAGSGYQVSLEQGKDTQ
jgi:hypothetical protein